MTVAPNIALPRADITRPETETTAAVGANLIIKFVLLMSKKMLPTASTLTRAYVVGLLGTTIGALPSFGVFALSVVGKVCPPSVESRILMFAALIGAVLVLTTSQV